MRQIIDARINSQKTGRVVIGRPIEAADQQQRKCMGGASVDMDARVSGQTKKLLQGDGRHRGDDRQEAPGRQVADHSDQRRKQQDGCQPAFH